MKVVFREEALADLDESGRLTAANNTREYAVPGLPYLVINLPAGDTIDVIAVFHTARDPDTKRRV